MAENPAPQPHGSSYVWPVTVQGLTLLESAARTSSVNSADQTNERHKGVRLIVDITALSGTSPTLDVKLQGKDPASGDYYDVPGVAFSQLNNTGMTTLLVYPGVAETANESVSDCLPDVWRISTTIGGSATPTVTYSVGASLIG